MKVLVCGGRDFADADFVDYALSAIRRKHGDFAIIQGGALGADALAKGYGVREGLPVIEVAAPWEKYDKRAGTLRNTWMLEYCEPDVVVAFKGGRGTAHMVRIARERGVNVWDLG